MTKLLLVGLGGFLGAIARYALASLVRERAGGEFPLSTLAVNLLGCLAIGALMAMAERGELFSDGTRLFLFVGVIGSFTTFSTFGYDGYDLLREGESGMGLLYLGGSVVVGVMCVWLGRTGVEAVIG